LDIPDDEKPVEGGLTLDVLIETLVQNNLDLRARSMEIPKAKADILTAGLRANPVLFADAQLVPYGNYSDQRPGGPVQYDVNVTVPLDLSRKRAARVAVAERARSVVEAQYQDAVRLQIDNLCTAYVDLLAARETVRFARAGSDGLRQVLQKTEAQYERDLIARADVNRVRIQLDNAEVGLMEAEETVLASERALVTLLNVAPPAPGELVLHRGLRVEAPPVPPLPELVSLALQARPDLAAYRMGIERARADVDLAMANRYEDVFLLVQPYTFQDNSPYNALSSHSWAVGVTVPLPIFNRNQGNILRTKVNVKQTALQMEDLQRKVVLEVEQAERAYAVTSRAVARLEEDALPRAEETLESGRLVYESGRLDLIGYLESLRSYNDVVRTYRDMLIRKRRAMLRLNTVVGQRVLP
jgi:cobalt-zinc-cadmium efflux system outer membrane protein